jgi:PAS domain-containing protein
VHDAAQDPAFRHNPLVTGPPALRFYAGCPLLSSNGYALGALAVMDIVPRTLDDARLSMLRMLADQVMVLLELRQRNRDLERVIAERDWMHEEVRQFADHLKEAQRIAGIGSWEIEAGSAQLRGTEEFYALLGIPAGMDAPVPLDALMRFIPAPDRLRLVRAFRRAQQSGEALDIEHRLMRRDGNPVYVRQRAEMRRAPGGGVTLAGTMQDVTEQRLSQEKFRLFHTCMSRVNEIVMITEAQPLAEPGPRVVFINDAFERLTGYTAQEILGRSPRLLQGPATCRAELDRIRQALRRRQSVRSELINYGKDGRQ